MLLEHSSPTTVRQELTAFQQNRLCCFARKYVDHDNRSCATLKSSSAEVKELSKTAEILESNGNEWEEQVIVAVGPRAIQRDIIANDIWLMLTYSGNSVRAIEDHEICSACRSSYKYAKYIMRVWHGIMPTKPSITS